MEEAPEARDSRDSRPRDRPKDRDHGLERQRDRDHGAERQRDRDHGQERQRNRDHDPERQRDRDLVAERQRDRDHEPERQRDRDHGAERQRNRDHDPERQRNRHRRRDQDGDRPRDPDRDRRGDRVGDRQRDRDPDRRGDRDRDWRENRDWDRRGDRDGDRRNERDPRLGRQDWEHPRSNGQRVREKSLQSRTQDVVWEQPRDRAPPPWTALGETQDPWSQRRTGFGRSESDYPSGRSLPFSPRPGLEEVEYYQSESSGLLDCHKCRYLCTGRGVLQIVEVILNGMVLICIVASYFVLAGFSASFASSGLGNSYYSPFEGTELEQVRQLDQQYTILRAPLVYGGLAVSLGLGVLTMGVLVRGAKSPEKLPRKWLLVEAVFSLLAAVGYCVGTGIFLHAALRINATDTCKNRERLYARNGLTWMNCQLAGTDGAAATFACLLVITYGASVVLAIRSYRQQQQHPEDSRKPHSTYSGPSGYWGSGTL
ncbi:MARVEL domain-containing protein 3 [Trichosurus vulpecula]|uniref:MARVEL domain-containing protein 3 n=1 Tax=Trichosurus vulpecula TaxID=9337 RepID=UPI00186AE67A|nr:MARVEL domain-containing protein 3 [Trichosurus vulpecula]